MPKPSLGFKPWKIWAYANGTAWSVAHHCRYPCREGFRVLCPDGRVRAVTDISSQNKPGKTGRRAGVVFRGKFINGYVKMEEVDGKKTVVFKPLNRNAFAQ